MFRLFTGYEQREVCEFAPEASMLGAFERLMAYLSDYPGTTEAQIEEVEA